MKRWITTLYNSKADGHVHTMEAETKEEVIKYMEVTMEMKHVTNENGDFLIFNDPSFEPDFEEARNCYSIFIGECDEDGFANDAVCW